MARATIRFLRRGHIVELRSVPPMLTLLDYLRLEEKSKGTKEGCIGVAERGPRGL
jgi:xanthine dehydrogenase small subunit